MLQADTENKQSLHWWITKFKKKKKKNERKKERKKKIQQQNQIKSLKKIQIKYFK